MCDIDTDAKTLNIDQNIMSVLYSLTSYLAHIFILFSRVVVVCLHVKKYKNRCSNFCKTIDGSFTLLPEIDWLYSM